LPPASGLAAHPPPGEGPPLWRAHKGYSSGSSPLTTSRLDGRKYTQPR